MDHYLSREEHLLGSHDKLTKNLLCFQRGKHEHTLSNEFYDMTSANDDNALLASYRDGNDEAFSQLVLRYQVLVVNACRRQVPSIDVDDCVQAVFIVLARRPTAAMRAPALAAWLHRVCSYVCLNARRTRNRWSPDMNNVEISHAIKPSSETQVDSPILAQLDTALLRLAEKQRAAVLLHAEHYSAKEIAGRLGVTTENAYKLTQRGLSALRTYFTRLGVPVGAATILTLLGSNVASAAPASIPAVAVLLSSSKAGSASLLAHGAATTLTIATIKTVLITTALTVALGASILFAAEKLRSDAVVDQITPTINAAQAVAPPLATTDEELEQEKFKQAAEAALAMYVPILFRNLGDDRTPAMLLFYNKLNQAREDALQQALLQWMVKDPARASMWVLNIKDQELRRSAQLFIVKSWAEKDPQKAAQWTLMIIDNQIRIESLFAVIKTWAEKDPQHAAAWVEEGLSENETQEYFLDVLMEIWFARDPAAALAWVNGIHDERARLSAQIGIARGWAMKDPSKAFAWIEENISSAEYKKAARKLVVNCLAENNPEQADTWLTAIVDEQERLDAMWVAVGVLATKNWEQAFDIVQKKQKIVVHHYTKVEGALESIIAEGARRDPQKALRLVEKIEGDKDTLLTLLASTWAEKDPAQATAWAMSLTNLETDRKERLLVLLAETWAIKDPEQATAWAMSLTNLETRNDALKKAVSLWAYKDPVKAVSWLESLSFEPSTKLLFYVATSWGLNDAVQAVAWADRIKDSGKRDIAYVGILLALANSHPDQALSLVSKISDANYKSEALEITAKGWGYKDPKAAAAWALNIGDLRTRAVALAGIARSWAKLEPEEAAVWANALDNKAIKETALSIIAQSWAQQNGEQVTAWLMNIADKALRRLLIGIVAKNYCSLTVYSNSQRIKWAASLSDEGDRLVAVVTVIHDWSLNNPKAASVWAETLPVGVVRTAAFCRIATSMSYSHRSTPEEAAALIITQEPGAARSDAIPEIVYNWIRKEPVKAAEWLMALEPGDERYRAVKYVVDNWKFNDERPEQFAEAATIFATKTTAGREQAVAIRTITSFWVNKDSKKAAQWAMNLEDAAARTLAVGWVANKWSQKNRKKATSWINTLDATTKQDIIKKHPNLAPEPKPEAESANEF